MGHSLKHRRMTATNPIHQLPLRLADYRSSRQCRLPVCNLFADTGELGLSGQIPTSRPLRRYGLWRDGGVLRALCRRK
jgi:hypothetical protein